MRNNDAKLQHNEIERWIGHKQKEFKNHIDFRYKAKEENLMKEDPFKTLKKIFSDNNNLIDY